MSCPSCAAPPDSSPDACRPEPAGTSAYQGEISGGSGSPHRALGNGQAMNELTVAVLGPGIMGEPIARNLLGAGHLVRVWNRTRAKAEPLAADGARVCDEPA